MNSASLLAYNGSIVVEGTQGFGLSLYHAREWPYRTSRDTTAHSFLGEVGLGVRDFEVVMAISGLSPYEYPEIRAHWRTRSHGGTLSV